MAAWLARRAGAISQLHIGLLYPDALALLPALLQPLAPALRRLVLEGGCGEWPYLWVDWRWLAGMSQARFGRGGTAQATVKAAASGNSWEGDIIRGPTAAPGGELLQQAAR